MRRRLVGVLMMAACLGNAQAQLHLKANVQNNHLWRGMEVSDGIVLLTDLSYTMVNDHVTVGLWGGCNSEGSYKEFNHYLAEIFHLRLCRISCLSERRLESRCWSWWSLRIEQSWRGCPLLRNHSRYRSRIAASIPRPQTRQLHHTGICQGYVESTEQPELFPDWSRSHPLLNLQCYRKNIITII